MESEENAISVSNCNADETGLTLSKRRTRKGFSVRQNENGYRFSTDSLILAHHVDPKEKQRIADLGTGCGIIALIIARKFPHVKIYGIEIQEAMAQLAYSNVLENRMEKQIEIVCSDMKFLQAKDIGGFMDLVVVNPPFGKSGHCRCSDNFEKNVAKHEVYATLSDVIDFSKRVLRVLGDLFIIYPTQRIPELLYALRMAELEPRWLRTVHPRFNANADRVIVKAVKHGRESMTIGPPLIVHGKDGSFTPEIKQMLNFKEQDC